ncbi:MAG TPA: OAM dimerization domain-containing protein [Myxococcota bacterium]|nr:OAM dimerization domain-containing protein [Myxococcota bacterium]HQK50056.1 OAM dimerization domain-containing protein [Myxococcota bacterium]
MNRPELAVVPGVDLQQVRPYGDTLGDGVVQVSFSLPLPACPEAEEAARQLALRMGLEEPQVYHRADLGYGFSFYILYGRCRHAVDVTRTLVPRVQALEASFEEINERLLRVAGRPLRVVGACTGSDAHTVGIDAILNMKGFAGEYGLERYPALRVRNLGAQVTNERLLHEVQATDADVVLVSQVVTQKDVHLSNLAEWVDLVEAAGLRDRLLMACGGPRIRHETALELGFDAGFGPGTTPRQVAAWILSEWERRHPPA